MKKIAFILGAISVALLAACGAKHEEVSFEDLQDARAQARKNATFSGIEYGRQNPRLKGYSLVAHGDSSQTNKCPQGDGWASLSYLKTEEGKGVIDKITIKCSTVSTEIGCYTDKDFADKSYKLEDGVCQPTNKVPFPLPKLMKD